MIRRPPTQISLQSTDVEDLKAQRKRVEEEEEEIQAQLATGRADNSEQNQQHRHYHLQNHSPEIGEFDASNESRNDGHVHR